MPSERDLRRRAKSIKNIQQLTRAMQLVAASKMRRAQESVLASRPFEEKLRSVLNDLAPYADPELSPLLMRREDPAGDFVESAEIPGLLLPRRIEDRGPFYAVYPEGFIEGWDGFPLADWVSDIVKCPVALGNDADVAGL